MAEKNVAHHRFEHRVAQILQAFVVEGLRRVVIVAVTAFLPLAFFGVEIAPKRERFV